MTEGPWIALQQDEIAPSSRPADAAWLTESPSMYDIPSYVRSIYEAGTGELRVEFRYLESEPLKEFRLSDYLLAKIGSRSNRVYTLLLDVRGYGGEKKERLVDAIEKSLWKAKGSGNWKIASKVVHAKGQKLINPGTIAMAVEHH